MTYLFPHRRGNVGNERFVHESADLTLASQVWLQSQDISVVTPFGRFKGWESVRDCLYINFLQKAFAERRLRPDNLAITVSDNAAWAVFDSWLTPRCSRRGCDSHCDHAAARTGFRSGASVS